MRDRHAPMYCITGTLFDMHPSTRLLILTKGSAEPPGKNPAITRRIGPVDGNIIASDNDAMRNRFRSYRTTENSYSFALARSVCRTGTGTNDDHRVTAESFLIGCGRYTTTRICDPVRPEAFGRSL